MLLQSQKLYNFIFNMNFSITSNAAAKIMQLITATAEPDEDLCLRIHIQGGGCSGFQYCFAFEETSNIEDDDWQFQHEEFAKAKVVIDKLSMQYLMGASLDYVQNIGEERFIINNPNASGTCGCGESFSV